MGRLEIVADLRVPWRSALVELAIAAAECRAIEGQRKRRLWPGKCRSKRLANWRDPTLADWPAGQ